MIQMVDLARAWLGEGGGGGGHGGYSLKMGEKSNPQDTIFNLLSN